MGRTGNIIREVHSAIAACFQENVTALTMAQALAWIGSRYTFNPATVTAQIRGSCFNVPSSHEHRPGTPKILFYNRLGRTYSVASPEQLESARIAEPINDSLQQNLIADSESLADLGSTFALESHLRDYLALNLQCLEQGLQLWNDQPPSVEFALEGRRIDILARDNEGCPVVIELKLDRGHERVAGQVLLYRDLICEYLKVERVRIMLVAAEITDELRRAGRQISDVALFEYTLKIETSKISGLKS